MAKDQMKKLVLLIATLGVLGGDLSAVETRRLNILFCFADDWGRYASCYAKLDAGPSLSQVIQIGGVKIPGGVSGRSLVTPLTSTKNGHIDLAKITSKDGEHLLHNKAY